MELANPQEAQETLRKKEEELKAAKDEIDDLKWKRCQNLGKSFRKSLGRRGFSIRRYIAFVSILMNARKRFSGCGAAYCQEEEGRDFLGRHTGCF